MHETEGSTGVPGCEKKTLERCEVQHLDALTRGYKFRLPTYIPPRIPNHLSFLRALGTLSSVR